MVPCQPQAYFLEIWESSASWPHFAMHHWGITSISVDANVIISVRQSGAMSSLLTCTLQLSYDFVMVLISLTHHSYEQRYTFGAEHTSMSLYMSLWML